MLKQLFASETIVIILRTLFANPKKSFYLRELVNLTNRYPLSVSQALRKLEKAKIVISMKKGNLKYFSLNEKNAIYSELKSMILKTTGAGRMLREALEKLAGLEFAFIYESTPLEKNGEVSGINLMLIGKVDLDKANSLVISPEKKLGQEINLMVFDTREWKKRKKRDNGFVRNILEERKIMLIGEAHEL